MSQTILFVYPTLFNPKVGGVERVTDLLAKEFIKLGHSVLYLHNFPNKDLMDYEYPCPIHFFPKEQWSNTENREFYHSFLKEKDINIVINQCGSFDDSELYIDVINNVKTISVLHSNPMQCYEYLYTSLLCCDTINISNIAFGVLSILKYPWFKRNYKKYCIGILEYLSNHTTKICLLSYGYIDEILKYYKKNVSGILKKLCVIPNPNTFTPHACIKKNQLLYVGRLDRGQKRPDRLLKIWKRLYKKFPDWEMVIVGDGKERLRLEKEAKKLERISFVGFQSPEQYYRDASILCLTSNFEGFGMVLTEAMSFGTIPFAFDSYSAVHDIIEDGKTGVLVKPFSINEYANKLASLMSDEDERNRMSANCITDVTRFSLDNIVNQWEDLFKSLVG